MYKAFVFSVFLILAVVRLISLDKTPIFIDEQTYLRLGRNFIDDPRTLFLSLKYLVFPIVPWILGAVQFTFDSFFNPLLLGRATMVISDLISAFLIYLIGRKLFDKRYGLMSALIYLSIPLNFFHSRLILLEPITSMFFLLSLYYFISTVNSKQKIKPIKFILDLFIIGILLSLSILSKPIALVLLPTLPLFLISTGIFIGKTKTKKYLYHWVITLGSYLLLFLIILPFALETSKGFSDYHVSANYNQIMWNFKKNIWLAWWWSKTYVPIEIIIVSLIAFIYAMVSKNWKITWVFCWLTTALLLELLIGTNFFPRHMFLVAPPIALITAFIPYKISTRHGSFAAVIILVSILFRSWQINTQILINPQTAPIALEDRQQFFEDWTSGEGLNNVANDLKTLSANKKITAYVEEDGGFGWSLKNIYDVGNTTILESENINNKNQYLQLSNSEPNTYSDTYVILNRNTEPPVTWSIELISSYPKLSKVRYIKIYKYLGN